MSQEQEENRDHAQILSTEIENSNGIFGNEKLFTSQGKDFGPTISQVSEDSLGEEQEEDELIQEPENAEKKK